VVFYGYFDDAGAARRGLALGSTPTFPDVGKTLPLDERAVALMLALRAEGRLPARGFVPRGVSVTVDREHVIKWGNRHCGEDKERVLGLVQVANDAVIEPFVTGRSVRILVVGERAWQLEYESADWRKNVGSTVTIVEAAPDLVARARQTTTRLGLDVAGVDYIVSEGEATLLEVNAYPGLDDVPGAAEELLSMAQTWWSSLDQAG
jgi:hypothetical protein